MKKIFITSLILFSIIFIFIVAKNKCSTSDYDNLTNTDKNIISEYNKLYGESIKKNLWNGFNLENKAILILSKDTKNAYIINPKNFKENLFTKKISIPKDFKLKSIYRIAPISPEIIKIRLNKLSNFNTIGKTYKIFNNDVYFIKYNKEESLDEKYSSSHFAPFLAHEAFHYYMQENWKILNSPEVSLSSDDIILLKQEYSILDNIRKELSSNNNKIKLIEYSKEYVDVVSKRLSKNKNYVESELSKETAEGTAQYITIKVSKLIGYDYGIMYFSNIQNVPFREVFKQIDAGNINIDYLYSKMPYNTGAQLCFLFDALNIPSWQEKLNKQTLQKQIYLYDILKDYLQNT